jgi:hypothetical protein
MKHGFQAVVFTLLSFILFIGCDDAVITSVEPSSGSSTGLYKITLHGQNFSSHWHEIWVGGIRAIGVEYINPNTIMAILQGSPVSGPSDVKLCNGLDKNCVTLTDGFFFDPPVDPVFDRMYSLGASLTTGIKSNSLSFSTQVMGPVAQIAKHAGAYIGLPLLTVEGIPGTTTPQDVYIGHDDEVWDPILRKWVFVREGELYNPAWEFGGDIWDIIQVVMPTLIKYPPFSLSKFRLNPDIDDIRNVSVPTAWMIDVLLGERIVDSAIGHLFADPYIILFNAMIKPSPSQILDVVNKDPSVVISFDLYAIDAALRNPDKVDPWSFKSILFLTLLDLATSNFYSTPGIDPGYNSIPFIVKTTGQRIQNPFWYHLIDAYQLIVDYETLGFPNFGDLNGNGYIDPDEVDIEAIIAEDDPTDNPIAVFIGNIPDPAYVPSGEGEENSELAKTLNSIFSDLSSRFDTIHVIDIETFFELIIQEANGEIPLDKLDIDNDGVQDLYLGKFGGFFSLDYLHPTNTAYAMYANEFIRTINQTLETTIPEIDITEVFANDPLASRNFSDEVLDYAGIPH